MVVNGIPLPANGYIDVGMLDTMLDMLLETAGAPATALLLLLDAGKHSLIQISPEKRK